MSRDGKLFLSYRRMSAGWLAFAAWLGFAASGVAGRTLEVTGDNVNLRAAPRLRSEVVGQVSSGERLTAGPDDTGDWVQVVPPQSVSGYVFARLVTDNVVQVAKLQVRAGPGINYTVLGALERDQRIVARRQVRDWIEVDLPLDSYVWISRDYVREIGETQLGALHDASGSLEKKGPDTVRSPDLSDEGKDKPRDHAVAVQSGNGEGEASSAKGETTVARWQVRKPPMPATEEATTDPELANEGRGSLVVGSLPADAAMAQGRVVERVGRLRKAGFMLRSDRGQYRLIGKDDKGRSVTVCYLTDGGRNLDELLGRRIIVTGREYWVQGLRFPVIAPEKLLVEE